MRYFLTCAALIASVAMTAQNTLTIEGKIYTNSDNSWMGVSIPRSVPTKFTFKNNSITSSNTFGYMLQAGDEEPGSTNNNLEGAVITGNKFVWKGSDMKSITHGLFTGHIQNAVIRSNYLDHVPMGIIRKSGNNMSDNGGAVAYNIVKSGAVGINIKGMSNVRIYNNTLYTDRTTTETWRGLIYVYTHTDIKPNSVSNGTKIYNNIFYTKYQTYCIQIDDAESAKGLESDYNVFYSESGTPMFSYCGVRKTFSEWQALGYDQHSVVINPNFKDLINFVPAARLDYGKDLGSEFSEGLAINAKWGTTDPETAKQNGKWQAGAVIYKEIVIPPSPSYSSSVITEAAPSKIELTFSLALASTAPVASSFSVLVNGATRSVNSVSVSGTKVTLTLSAAIAYGDKVTVAYTKPGTNPLQSTSGGQVASFTAQSVTNKRNAPPPPNKPPVITIFSPVKSTSFVAPATITIEATASDPDGSVVKVEFYNGTVKLGERTAAPWSYTWKNVAEGTYSVTAAATDNSNARTVSAAVTVEVEGAAPAINLLPEVSILSPLHNEDFEVGASVPISVMASDPDGTVTKVEYFVNGVKVGESTEEPFTFTFNADSSGDLEITAIAWDNLQASSSCEPVVITLRSPQIQSEPINIYPTPNHGMFTVNFTLKPEACDNLKLAILNMNGKALYVSSLFPEEQSRAINLGDSIPGIYVLRITDCKGIIATKRFIIL